MLVWRRLRLRHLWLLLPFWIAAWRAGRDIDDNSFLWHVRAGLDQSAAGEVLRTDPYSFTKVEEPWRTQSWLIELGYARLEEWFGDLTWVPWFLFLVVAIVLVALVAGIVRSGVHLAAGALVLLLLAWILQPYMSPRPVLLSYVFFAVLGLIVSSRRPALWSVPGLMWLWAGIHGSFIVGVGILVLDAMRRRERRSWLAVVLSLAAVSATAHGLAVWEILYRFALNREGLEAIQEWMPPDFTNYALMAVLPLLALLLVGLSAGKIESDALWILIPMLVFALLSTRNVMPALLVMAPWLAGAAGVLPDMNEAQLRPALVWATASALLVTAIMLVARPVALSAERFPSRSMVAELDSGPVFHSMGPGGVIIYYAGSARPVFVDDRVELYGPEFLDDYLAVNRGDEWRDTFAAWDIEQALLHEDAVLVPRLEDDGWMRCGVADGFVLLRPACDS